MDFWIIIWKIVFVIGLLLFIVMFLFVTIKGFFEILDLLKREQS